MQEKNQAPIVANVVCLLNGRLDLKGSTETIADQGKSGPSPWN